MREHAVPTTRYDGLAEWYDEEQLRVAQRDDAPIEEFAHLVGRGRGRFVEIGCGTGITSRALEGEGWTVIGLDLSADQLDIARTRCHAVLRADAHRLPFPTASIDALGMAFVHTDVESFDAVMREVGRALAPNGTFTCLGVHPCFVGHHISSPAKVVRELVVVPGYRDAVRVDRSENFGPGIRSRVGAQHVPLSDYLTAFIDAGLVLDRVIERGDGIVPWMLGVQARKR
jgi:SAM-dependent methyltransferase